ncbi:glycosyltransferase [Emticicia fluvialis]|uniref:glycosyltransferase n=1 Tax=Emticicia fluvialis TaxID=2974474 RepID=UPI0021653CDF|nr:glycosyltransferase [Emticicia fluvialis]
MKLPGLLFIPASIRSHVMPAMYVADLLADKYEIYFAVTDDILADLVEKNSYKAIRQSGVKVMFNMESTFIAIEKKKKVSFWSLSKAYWNNELFRYRQNELSHILEVVKPASVVIDIFSSTDYLVLKSLNQSLNIVFFNPMLSTYRVNGYPIVSEGAWLKNRAIEPKKIKGKPGFWWNFTHPKRSILAYLNQRQEKHIFQKSGVSENTLDKENHFTKMFRGVPELIAAPLEFEFSPHVRQEWQHYLGLCTRSQRQDTELDTSFAELWPDIKKHRANGQKIIYCSFGTYYAGPDRTLLNFVSNLVEVIHELGNIQLIISVNRFVIETFKSQLKAGGNICFFSRVPQLEVLKESDLLITHGGLGSIKEAIEFGVPMLVYPLDMHYDQNGNGLKVEYHGIGLRGNFAYERTNDMKSKIERLLNHAVFKEKTTESLQKIKSCYSHQRNQVILNQLGL